MNKMLAIILFSVCLFGDLLLPMAGEGQAVIKVVGNEAPPFRIIDEKNYSGIYFDIMKEVGNRIDSVIEFEEQPFKRALYSIKTGQADVICGPNRTREREAYMIYLNATLPRVNKVFYVHPDALPISKYEDLQSKSILTLRGPVYFDRFDQDPFLKKTQVDTYEQAIRMITMKRADVVIMPEQEGDYLLKQLGLGLKKSPYIVKGRISYIAISKKSRVAAFKKKIEEAITQINKDGTMDKILVKYR